LRGLNQPSSKENRAKKKGRELLPNPSSALGLGETGWFRN